MITWAYVAGFLDGDGWITKTKYKRKSDSNKEYGFENYIYAAGMTQLIVCENEMRQIYDFLVLKGIKATWLQRKQRSNISGNGDMVNIHIKHQESLIEFLKKIMPYLLLKKKIGQECLEYLENKKIQREKENNAKKKLLSCQTTNIYWSREEIDILKRLLKEGYSNTYIASQLNRSVNSIGHKIYRMKIGRWKKTNVHSINERQ